MARVVYPWRRLAIILAFCTVLQVVSGYQCHSCTTYCKTLPNGKLDPETCDCESETSCSGDKCFTKVEIFPDELTAIIQKGCASGLSTGLDGCHYAGQAESVHCYCEGEKCNNKRKSEFYVPKTLPTVECCECSEPHGDECADKKCKRTCRGNYCLVDFDGVEQGCGLGLPRLQSFMRINDYPALQGQTTCARYEATLSTVVHGCVCTNPSGFCNQVGKTREYQLEKVVERRLDDQNYCYSLHEKAKKPFGKDVFRKSDTCEGHYCFISLTTSELVVESASFEENLEDHDNFIGMVRPRYEIMAGCLKVDSDEKVTPGCTTEYATNSSDPISKHCVCDSHLCNYFDLLSNKAAPLGRQIIRPKSVPKTNESSTPDKQSITADTASHGPNRTEQIPNMYIYVLLTLLIKFVL
uniref:UPAR/Ly6 domain-containing protein n=1 Tax=Panagrellus redivivus TaxID=6233 RepID=A0A7E4VKS9_PANRE